MSRLVRPGPAQKAQGGSPRRKLWRVAIGGSLAAALVFLATIQVLWHRFPTGEPAGWKQVTQDPSPARSGAPSLADVLVEDLEHFVAKGQPLQIVSSDAGIVSDWLTEKSSLAVQFARTDAKNATLLGGRKCIIAGEPAAFAAYRVGDEVASVIALAKSDESLSGMKRVDRDGRTWWIDHCKGHTVMACRRGELVYAVVARLSEDALMPLMPGSAH